jgi:hypothetical protein
VNMNMLLRCRGQIYPQELSYEWDGTMKVIDAFIPNGPIISRCKVWGPGVDGTARIFEDQTRLVPDKRSIPYQLLLRLY